MRAFITIVVLVALGASATAEPSAEQLYNEGQQAFDLGDYTTAIARWQSSYEVSKLPLLVLNIAQAHRLAGECAFALSAYRRYVTLDPTSDQRGLADGFVAELEPKCGQPSPPPVDHIPHQVEDTGSGRNNLKLAGLMTGGAGVVLTATGLLFGRRASTLGDEVTRDCAVSCDWAGEKSKESDGKRYATIGKILDGVGLAAVAVGIVTYIYGASQRQATIAIQPSTNGASLTWSGQW